MEQNKWEFKAYSHAIADTGDYDGHYEITNGNITLITKDDYEETERQLKTAVAALNRWGINFYDQKVEDLSIDIYCMKDAQRWKDEEFAALQAKCERLTKALKDIANRSSPHHFIYQIADKALSGEGEKEESEQELFDKWVKENAAVLGESHWLVGAKHIHNKRDLKRVYNYLNQKEDKQ